AGFSVEVSAAGERLVVCYESLLDDHGFIRPEVIVEFGARSTGDPHEKRQVACDAEPHLPDIVFPTANPSVMLAERTFWEKATAIHVFCRQQRRRGERLSRHWHDVARLDEVGYARKALADRALSLSVARHKAAFFREKDAEGRWIDYGAAVSGELRLVPDSFARNALERDYERMISDGMLLDDAEPFDRLIERCSDIEVRANNT
ncbi:MAG: nucleotidyl transferase AbiEii/AbiGii toxin family protein, partial [Acidobacteriia bacterium]|nr:nucleotidyl transferase AbiEii/AbiGii toxin family protein [Terriglobia bacterium]